MTVKNAAEADIPQKNIFRRGKRMYIAEAMAEYLISIPVAGSFLAALTGALGMSDSLTGILSSVISLGCLFQLLSVPIRTKKPKRFVTLFSITNQLLFMFLYMVPLLGGSAKFKTGLFIAVIFSAYVIYNIAHPKKIAWLMSLVDDGSRGRFTADKEIISLLSGMVFTALMGALIDRFRDTGNIKTAFLLCAATMLVLTAFHTVTLIFTPSPFPANSEKRERTSCGKEYSLFKNKSIMRIALLFVIWNIAAYASAPFYGTYQINELAFSLKFVSVLGIAESTARIAVSRLLGAYADRRSFTVMIRLCFLVMAAGYLCCTFAVPANGKIMFLIYGICHGIAMGGINSALINLVFDYVPASARADALALSQAAAGTSGFFSALVFSLLVSRIQRNGNRLFGLPIYAQQAVSVIALAATLAAALYTTVIDPKKVKTERK